MLPSRSTGQQARAQQPRCPALATGPRAVSPTTNPRPSSRQQPDTRRRTGHADKTIPAAGMLPAGFRLPRPPTASHVAPVQAQTAAQHQLSHETAGQIYLRLTINNPESPRPLRLRRSSPLWLPSIETLAPARACSLAPKVEKGSWLCPSGRSLIRVRPSADLHHMPEASYSGSVDP